MIPQDTVSKILDTARIEEVVSDFVSLKRRGASFVACCPFHNEKTPSFYVTPAKGIFKCFGCGKSGTAVGFVMQHESLSYVDALKYLARKYSIEVIEKEESAEEIAARQRTESLYLVSDYAAKFFASQLSEGEGKTVGYRYFRERGLEDETIRKYGLGWAPRGRGTLVSKALSDGYKEEYLIAAGLAAKSENGTLSDRFFERVIFPIHSVSGRVIAFGGRTLKGGHPAMKYVNTPTTDIYVKERSLYGIWFAKNEIARKDRCYLVEGYLDVLSMHQLGILNTVASSGTSLTIEQIRLISKFTKNITIMYDGDGAGINAALRGIGLVLQEGMQVKVVLLPDGDDPDSFSQKHSLEEVEGYISNHEQDFISFKSDILERDAGNDPLKRAQLINDIADTIALIPDTVLRSVYVQQTGARFGISEQTLYERIRQSRLKKFDDERKEERRKAARAEATRGLPIDEEDVEVIDTPAKQQKDGLLENPALAPSEKELLEFILNNGTSLLEFESDSELYDPENSWTVADFIREALEQDGLSFSNSVYKRLYDKYFDYYDSSPDITDSQIATAIMNGEDRPMADLAAELTEPQYRLTVKNFSDSMTAVSAKLANFVPRAILVYQLKTMQQRRMALCEELKTTSDTSATMSIMAQISNIGSTIKILDEKLGRIR